ncbi:hypothetical protein D7X33_12110, partial [Butyricicoccus sp. 1XD8-22]
GLCPCTPRLRGERRGSAPAPRAYAAGGGALPLHPAPARRAPKGLVPLESLSSPAGGTGLDALDYNYSEGVFFI